MNSISLQSDSSIKNPVTTRPKNSTFSAVAKLSNNEKYPNMSCMGHLLIDISK
jgi:hypothetical protein